MKIKIKVTVLENYDGFTADVVSTVERVIIRTGNKDKYGNAKNPEKFVSYKGKKCKVFWPAADFGTPACIAVR